MTNKELREKSILELEQLVLDMRQKLFALRFQNYNGQLETPSNIKDTQKTIAKILTIINEKHHGQVIAEIQNVKPHLTKELNPGKEVIKTKAAKKEVAKEVKKEPKKLIKKSKSTKVGKE